MARWEPITKDGQKIFQRLHDGYRVMLAFQPEAYDGAKTIIVLSRGKLIDYYGSQKRDQLQPLQLPFVEYIILRADIHAALIAYDEGKFTRWYVDPNEAAERMQTEEGTDAP